MAARGATSPFGPRPQSLGPERGARRGIQAAVRARWPPVESDWQALGSDLPGGLDPPSASLSARLSASSPPNGPGEPLGVWCLPHSSLDQVGPFSTSVGRCGSLLR